MDDPTSTALQIETHTGVMGTDNGDGTYTYDIILDTPFTAEANTKYWFVAQWVGNYPPQWGICVSSSQQLHDCMQGFPMIGYQYWTDPGYGDMAFQLYGWGPPPPPPHWPTGTYPVAGIIKNYGEIFPESNIPVNAKITHIDNSTVIYDENIVVPGPLAPGGTALATFPNVTFLDLTSWEGKYRLEIQTMLPGDAHPENDKKTLMFYIESSPPPMPPITNHTLTGTMGDNGWYVSSVVITLTAQEGWPPLNLGDSPKWPPGINHTYYKIQNSDPWSEYHAPITVSVDGRYNLSYYSVDNAGNAEQVKGPFPFKIDKTAPAITLTVTSLNLMKTIWLLNATVSDNMSGVNRVEFYVDYASVGIVTKPGPYIWTYQGSGKVASAIVYDDAGNAMSSPYVTCQDLLMQANNEVLSMHQNSALMTLTQRFLVSR
jgi:hypothetical protein